MRPVRQLKELVCSWSFVAGCILGLVILLMTKNDGTPESNQVMTQKDIEAVLVEQAQARFISIKSGLKGSNQKASEHQEPVKPKPKTTKKGVKGKAHVKPPTETKDEDDAEQEAYQDIPVVAPKPRKTGPGNRKKDTAKVDEKKEDPLDEDPSFQSNIVNYQKALQRYAVDDVIVISSVDSAYLDLGLNLYYTSFKKFNIENYVFVASDANVCSVLVEQKINCVEFIHVGSSDKAEPFYTIEFMLKSFVKTKLVLEALKLDLQVFLVDVDMVFYQNPLEHFDCDSCDIEAMAENDKQHVINTGFYLAKPTQACIELHEEAAHRMARDAKANTIDGSDQKYFNNVLREMRGNGTISSQLLDTNKFPNAMVFFEYGRRVFIGDGENNDEIIVMHNNFVVTLEAKIYRFKEYGLWNLNTNGYYSDKTTKYLMYDNPITITNDTDLASVIIRETEALKIALKLGLLLKRVVILPVFHNYRSVCRSARLCSFQWETCSLQGIYFIQHFDKYFAGRYREHSFLSHPLVPKNVKKSQSPVYVLESTYTQNELGKLPKHVTLLQPRDVMGINKRELKENFTRQTEKYSVLRFHSLYVNVTNYNVFGNKFPKALTRTGYMQNPKGDKYLQKKKLKV